MIKMFTKKRNKKGFTLIELIVVIAILGILAALAIPRLTGVQEKANRKAVLANLKAIDNAVQVYMADNNVGLTGISTATIIGADKLIPKSPNTGTATNGVAYTIADGVVTATVTGSVAGLTAGTYTLADTSGLQ